MLLFKLLMAILGLLLEANRALVDRQALDPVRFPLNATLKRRIATPSNMQVKEDLKYLLTRKFLEVLISQVLIVTLNIKIVVLAPKVSLAEAMELTTKDQVMGRRMSKDSIHKKSTPPLITKQYAILVMKIVTKR